MPLLLVHAQSTEIETMAESSSDEYAVFGIALGACLPTLCTMESPRPWLTITRFWMLSKFGQTVFFLGVIY